MTRQRHLHRTALLVAACTVFAATATGSALAWSGSVHPAAAPAVTAQVTDEPSTGPAADATRPTARAATTAATTTTTTTATTTRTVARNPSKAVAKPATKRITIRRYVDAPGSQAAIDKCNLVLWTRSPMWLAAHNWCGFQWMAFVKTGTVVTVTKGAAAGTYVVTGHKRLTRQSGELPHLTADLVLQTCVGSGTGLTLLRRV